MHICPICFTALMTSISENVPLLGRAIRYLWSKLRRKRACSGHHHPSHQLQQ